MKRWIGTFICLIPFLLAPALTLGEIYYWVDHEGNQRFTTSLETIPEPYRSRATLLPYAKSPPAPPEPLTSPASKAGVQIPFVPGSPVLVSARINGSGPVTLILDTGADRTLISPSALSRLGISREHATQVQIRGVTGTAQGDALWVDSVEVGEAKVGPLLIVVHDSGLKGAEGLLGRDFLGHFNITIDPREQKVTLQPNR